eukprot:CAMPEP_0181108310 /NCGR_PEP_ID=MMETSP1071-20121207/17561_1 /TAXON_ID=35127 /ORGANISM="Thalassiosira sp., Strain NH16" /LENGTH=431 /DNA_ID=CAMNT_0023191903 /DNA_START=55 /DNA_END=1351 /DNA_ORIENTATION=-
MVRAPHIPIVLCSIALMLILSSPGRSPTARSSVQAFSPPYSSSSFSSSTARGTAHRHAGRRAANPTVRSVERSSSHRATLILHSSAGNDEDSAAMEEMTEMRAAQTRETPDLSPEDISFVSSLHAACGGNIELMEGELAANLDNMHPRLVVALQMAAEEGGGKEGGDDDVDGEEGGKFEAQMVALGTALRNVLDVRLKSGREMLADLLKSGEIRKLDSMIGKAAKDGKLDMSFFSVLSMNMKDAAFENEEGGGASVVAPTLAQGEGQPEVEGEEGQPMGANRLQILQHIYTRCQEELEKNVAPGMGLLNKLLRTEISSIRSNQLQHYLGPQATSITSPDGKTIELGGTAKPLVSHTEFVEALSGAVEQIRTLEAAGGTDRLSATNLVESIRQVAMEARVVLLESFGEGSEELDEFQGELQQVFRPGSRVES